MTAGERIREIEHLINRYKAGVVLLQDGHLSESGIDHVQSTNTEVLSELMNAIEREAEIQKTEEYQTTDGSNR